MTKESKKDTIIGKSFLTIFDPERPRLMSGTIVAEHAKDEAFIVTMVDESHRDRVGTVVMDAGVVASLMGKSKKEARQQFDTILEAAGDAMQAYHKLNQLCEEFDVNPSVSLQDIDYVTRLRKSLSGDTIVEDEDIPF